LLLHVLSANTSVIYARISIGSDRRPETKQGIEGKNDRFRSGVDWSFMGAIGYNAKCVNR